MRRHTAVGCVGAVVVLAAALVAVWRTDRTVRRFHGDMEERLRALVDGQAGYHRRTGRYAASPAEAGVPSEPERVRLVITAATDSGWTAEASHPATSVVCRVWVGRPRGPGREARPRCE